MGIDYCNETQVTYWVVLLSKPRDMDPRPLYFYLCPIMIIVCFLSIIFNAILMSISRQSKFINKSPILLLSLNLAVTDLIASLLNGLGILFNSLLPEVFDIKISQCQMLTFEAVRCTALVASALHLLALALVHYKGIVNPLHYRTINVISIGCWIIPLTIIIVWFSSTPCQGFQTPECDFLFLFGSTYRYMILTVFAVPLLLMSIIYLRIFIIISRHQKGRRMNHERSTLTRGVIKAAGHIGTATAAVDLPELINSAEELRANNANHQEANNYNDDGTGCMIDGNVGADLADVVGDDNGDAYDGVGSDRDDNSSKCPTCAALLASERQQKQQQQQQQQRQQQQQQQQQQQLCLISQANSNDCTRSDVGVNGSVSWATITDKANGEIQSGLVSSSGRDNKDKGVGSGGESQLGNGHHVEPLNQELMKDGNNIEADCISNDSTNIRREVTAIGGARDLLANHCLAASTRLHHNVNAAATKDTEPIKEDHDQTRESKAEAPEEELASRIEGDANKYGDYRDHKLDRSKLLDSQLSGAKHPPTTGIIFEVGSASCQIVVGPSRARRRDSGNSNSSGTSSCKPIGNSNNSEELIKDLATTSSDKFAANEQRQHQQQLQQQRQRCTTGEDARDELKDGRDNGNKSSGSMGSGASVGSTGSNGSSSGVRGARESQSPSRRQQDKTLSLRLGRTRDHSDELVRDTKVAEEAAAFDDSFDASARPGPVSSWRQHSEADPSSSNECPMVLATNASIQDLLAANPLGQSQNQGCAHSANGNRAASSNRVASCELASLPHGPGQTSGADASAPAAIVAPSCKATANSRAVLLGSAVDSGKADKRPPLCARFSLNPAIETGGCATASPTGPVDDGSPLAGFRRAEALPADSSPGIRSTRDSEQPLQPQQQLTSRADDSRQFLDPETAMATTACEQRPPSQRIPGVGRQNCNESAGIQNNSTNNLSAGKCTCDNKLASKRRVKLSRANTIGFKIQLRDELNKELDGSKPSSPASERQRLDQHQVKRKQEQLVHENRSAAFGDANGSASRQVRALVASAEMGSNGKVRLAGRSSISSTAAAIFGLASGGGRRTKGGRGTTQVSGASSLRLQLHQVSGDRRLATASNTITSGGSTTGLETAAAEYGTANRVPGATRQTNYVGGLADDQKQQQLDHEHNLHHHHRHHHHHHHQQQQQQQHRRPMRIATRTSSLTNTTTTTTYYEPQRRHIHAMAVPQTNTKALVTTLLILGTYFISYVPAIIVQVLTCIDNCPYPLYDIPFSRRVLLGTIPTLLLIAKSIIDPFIYSYRMGEIQMAINRYLSKRRSKGSSYAGGASFHASQKFTNNGAATTIGGDNHGNHNNNTNSSNHHHHHHHHHQRHHPRLNHSGGKKLNDCCTNNKLTSQANNDSSFKLFSSSTNTSFRGSVFSRTTSVFSRNYNSQVTNQQQQQQFQDCKQDTTTTKLLQKQQTNHTNDHDINQISQPATSRNLEQTQQRFKKAYSTSSTSSSAATATTATIASSTNSIQSSGQRLAKQSHRQDGRKNEANHRCFSNQEIDDGYRVSNELNGEINDGQQNELMMRMNSKLSGNHQQEFLVEDDDETDVCEKTTFSETSTNEQHNQIAQKRPLIVQRITFDLSRTDLELESKANINTRDELAPFGIQQKQQHLDQETSHELSLTRENESNCND